MNDRDAGIGKLPENLVTATCDACKSTFQPKFVTRHPPRFCYHCRETGEDSRFRDREQKTDSPTRRKRRLALLAAYKITDVPAEELERALAMTSGDWGHWLRIEHGKFIGPTCSSCGILEAALKGEDAPRCWLRECPMRTTPVDEAELDRHAAAFARFAMGSRESLLGLGGEGGRKIGHV